MSLVPPSFARSTQPTYASPDALDDDFLCATTQALEVDVHTEGDHHVITVKGEIDLATAPELSEVVRGILETARHLVIDLDQVGFLDSTGLSVLVASHRRITSQGGSMVLVCNNARCMKVMNITGLSRVFTFCPSTAAATGVDSA